MKYTVLSNLKHSGEEFTQGDQIELSKEFAQPLLRDGVISDKKVPVIKEKDWKKGPEDIIPGPDAEIDSTGNAPEKEEEAEDSSNDTTEESKIAGAQDDTGKIDENLDANL